MMLINKIPAKYLIICDTEVMFNGTKTECLEYYNNLPNPVNMYLIRIESKRELRRGWK